MAYYITTPLYYVNDLPHIGHAYATIAADIWARARRLFGDEVFFLTGTDEHGGKIAQAAAAKGIKPQAYTDEIAQAYQSLWNDLLITNDDFIRTTQPRHIKVVESVFGKLFEQGDIRLGSYEDWYCTPCETFLTQEELKPTNLCPDCGRIVEKLREESHFFALSKYGPQLKALYQSKPDFLSPRFRAKEITNFVDGGLKDLSITRGATRVSWGIPVPASAQHTIYVWFDALLNYISALGYSSDEVRRDQLFLKFWPGALHLVGKEIFRFHAVIWPAMLMALGVEPPRQVFAHGWWTVEGEKISKSKGNAVSPKELLRVYPADALRYYLFREMPFGSDGDFSHARLKDKTNNELANVLGNLHWRLVSMIRRYFNGRVTKKGDLPVFAQTSQRRDDVNRWYLSLNFHEVLNFLYAQFTMLNQEVDKRAPWRLHKEGRLDELESLLFDWSLSLCFLARLFGPFCPVASEKILKGFGIESAAAEGLRNLNSLQVQEALQEPLFTKLL